MGELILGISGIRGIVGTGLTAAKVRRLVEVWGRTFSGSVVVGRDSRPSGGEFQQAAIQKLLQQRHQVYRVDIVPTPTLGRAVRQWRASAGLQITASHNPPEWNGLKFFNAEGRVLPPEEAAPLLEQFRVCVAEGSPCTETVSPEPVVADSPAVQECGEQALQEHVNAVLACVPVEKIRRRGFRVLVDGNGGAGGPLARQLLEALGCQVVAIHCEADGFFHHAPEPNPHSLEQVAVEVARHGCDLGIALDADADRLVLLDEQGRCLSEEYSLALAVEARLRYERGPVVTNLSTSRVVEIVCQRYGCPCYRTPVGEAHVVAGMRTHRAILGGEGNGGIIDPRIGWVRDPFIGMALILQLLSELGRPLSAVVSSFPSLVMRKEKLRLDGRDWPQARRQLLAGIVAESVDTRDGLYFRWADRWLHVRPSNTEPIVRIIAESPSETDTNALVQLALDTLAR
jgi:phosphomannomutase